MLRYLIRRVLIMVPTLFVTSAFADQTGRLWWIELERAIARLDRVRIAIGSRSLDLPARSPQEKAIAFDAVYRDLRAGGTNV